MKKPRKEIYSSITDYVKDLEGYVLFLESKRKRNYKTSNRRVECFEKDGRTVDFFDSIKQASESLRVNNSCIMDVLKGRQKTTFSHKLGRKVKFRYIEG